MTQPVDQAPRSHGVFPLRRGTRTLLAALLATTMLAGVVPAVMAADQPSADATQPAARMPDFAALVKRVKPSVVSITTKMAPTAVSDQSDDQDGTPQGGQRPQGLPPGFPFFMIPRGMNPGGGTPQRAVEARGSGFIIASDGTIVTNNHVVDHAKSVSVTLDDGTVLPARIIGRDPRTDVAVLRVNAGHPLPAIQLGDSADVEPGQWVVAMGNPFGLGGTVTAGIVSARGRDIGAGPYDDFIQIDAPINHGNSGGPLFTQDGKVIGINTAIYSPTGGSVGIGFAIPSNTVRGVVTQLEASGHVTRGYIGVAAQKLTPDMASAMGISARAPDTAGALIASVVSDGPAAEAGLQPGDVITSVDGHKIADPRGLARTIAAIAPGGSARIDVVRDGSDKEMTVKIAPQPNDDQTAVEQAAKDTPRLGLSLAPMSQQARAELHLPASTHGVVIAEVAPGSPADHAGLQAGDVLMGVGGERVNTPREAIKALHAHPGKTLALRILRDGQAVFVAINPHESDAG